MSETSSPAGINPLVARLSPPPIPKVQACLSRYDGGKGPSIDLSQAVPGYLPHPDLLGWLSEAAGSASLAGYGAIQGELGLREALARDVSTAYGSKVEAKNVQITAGGNQAFFITALALTRPGDEVLIVRPFYFNHEMTLDMLGITVRFVDALAEDGFVPNAEALKEAMTKKTRAVYIVTPNNPTGAVYPSTFLEAAYEICRDAGAYLVVDETYRDFLDQGAGRPHALFSKPDWESHFVHLYSFSKVFCIPGHRVGAVLCGGTLMEQLLKVMDNLQICAPRPAQHAVAKAIETLGEWRVDNRAEIALRREAFKAAIASVDGWEIASIGAYFAYLKHPFGAEDAMQITQRLAGDHGILMLPGTGFGANQQAYLRAAFANAESDVIATLRFRLPSSF
ncbi:Aspartate/methionine/tyrosine aminotransferase [Cohaesibacter sp. ES.047]|uniref:aminotransferase n=1 Tax=Cohaesibacter sp. ES.047 TaxID=1798205 RepID=UPI000BB6CDF2|nr:aminotransferase [Cohaesibacter sp. ES.047]SNY94396.1 Aspartate/methionine/tyrosine aminotransferase [Cohaesibacter sp. ES.047]